ncbi:hypothetical protein KTG14_00545 [Planococcus sp. CP5-4_YE]|uniref:hypothetical protein n=1 Tax=unclassified Planococcus (in: firmicutes) TaxID=2662419 RepID=UPI001C216AE6|nr:MULTISPECIES: hypothetical protein [unclassified Planococcus (in: firmicutes)]MBU9671908.1 hypothetical protein [Planococcus sp. CP5-4_YE]
MFIQEEVLFKSEKKILDADCKRNSIIVLLKGKGESIVQLDGKIILLASPHQYNIRFTASHFCLLDRLEAKLSFYTLTGDFVSEHDTGHDVYELFPYKGGVLCSYGDEGAFGEDLGKNMLNYFAPLREPESFIKRAIENNLLYDPLIVRHKPFACISWQNNELIFLNGELQQQKAMELPILPMHLIAFALTYEYAVFIENNKIWLWKFEGSADITEYPAEYSYKTRAIYHRHKYLFLTVSDHEVRAFKPVMSEIK